MAGQTPWRREWTLDAIVTAVLTQSPLIEAARARVGAAQGARRTANALPNPVGTYWLENAGFFGRHGPTGLDPETTVSATLPIEPLFRRSSRVRGAEEDIKAAEAALAAARHQVALDAVRAYYRIALAQVSVQAADDNRAGLERLVAYNRTRVAEGAAAEGDLIRVQVELERAATEVALAEVELSRARAGLWAWLGETAVPIGALDTIRVVVPVGTTATPTFLGFEDAMSRARLHRPELLEARARVGSAVAAADYEHALTVRQIGGTFGFKRLNGANSMVAGINMAIPLFDRNRGGIERATGERLAAEKELAWAERQVAAEVQGAYAAATRLSAQVTALQSTFLDRADESQRIALVAYQEGAGSLLQVLDASRTLADARLIYYSVLFAQRESVIDLALAAGADPTDAVASLHDSAHPNNSSSPDGGRQ